MCDIKRSMTLCSAGNITRLPEADDNTTNLFVASLSSVNESTNTSSCVVDFVDDVFSHHMWIFFVLQLVTCISGTVGNSLVVIAILSTRSLHTGSNWYILNLAITDLLVCTVLLPYSLMSMVLQAPPVGCSFMGFLMIILILTSSAALAAIAFNRYVLIVMSRQRYIAMFTHQKIILSIVGMWFTCIVAASPPLYGMGSYQYNPRISACSFTWDTLGIIYVNVFCHGIISLPTMVWTGYAYGKIFSVFYSTKTRMYPKKNTQNLTRQHGSTLVDTEGSTTLAVSLVVPHNDNNAFTKAEICEAVNKTLIKQPAYEDHVDYAVGDDVENAGGADEQNNGQVIEQINPKLDCLDSVEINNRQVVCMTGDEIDTDTENGNDSTIHRTKWHVDGTVENYRREDNPSVPGVYVTGIVKNKSPTCNAKLPHEKSKVSFNDQVVRTYFNEQENAQEYSNDRESKLICTKEQILKTTSVQSPQQDRETLVDMSIANEMDKLQCEDQGNSEQSEEICSIQTCLNSVSEGDSQRLQLHTNILQHMNNSINLSANVMDLSLDNLHPDVVIQCNDTMLKSKDEHVTSDEHDVGESEYDIERHTVENTGTRSGKPAKRHSMKSRRAMRVVINMFTVWCTFIICYAPLILGFIIDHYKVLPASYYHMALTLGYMNSALNPLLYGVMNKTYRAVFANLLTCKQGQ